MVVAVVAAIGGVLTTTASSAKTNKAFFNAKNQNCEVISSDCGEGADLCNQIYDIPTCSVLLKRN